MYRAEQSKQRPLIECSIIYRAEQSKQRPLLGEKGPIESLRTEYAESSPIFIAKVAHLCATHSSIRRTRQDGNCFYRCFIFGLLEALLDKRDAATSAAVIKSVQGLEDTLEIAGITKLVWEDAMQVLMELLKAVSDEQVPLSRPFSSLHVQVVFHVET
jgi:ubiquitin thioesterase protein OTUB1